MTAAATREPRSANRATYPTYSDAATSRAAALLAGVLLTPRGAAAFSCDALDGAGCPLPGATCFVGCAEADVRAALAAVLAALWKGNLAPESEPLRGAEQAGEFVRQWKGIRAQLDEGRFEAVLARLVRQAADAAAWRDKCVGYFAERAGRR